MWPACRRKAKHLSLSIKICLIFLSAGQLVYAGIPAQGDPGRGEEFDGRRVVMKVDCYSAALGSVSADTIARQLPAAVSGVENCTSLPVPCWLQCDVKSPAASAAQPAQAVASADDAAAVHSEVSRVTELLKTLAVSSAAPGSAQAATLTIHPILVTAATAASASSQRLFTEVGRSRLLYTSIRQLSAEPQARSNSYPAECSARGCPAMWGMNRIKAPAVWRKMSNAGLLPLTITKAGTMVDTGTDIYNRNIKDQINVKDSRTYAAQTARSQASNNGKAGSSSHGTHTFCTVAGAWNDAGVDPSGVAGVLGPAQGKILSCNAFGDNGDFDGASVADLVKCLSWAVRKRAHWVVNMSLGGFWPRSSPTVSLLRDAMKAICDKGGIAVVAANNAGENVDDPSKSNAVYPAAFAGGDLPCVIAVGAVENTNGLSQLAYFSNWGEQVKIVAPGVDITSCKNSGSAAMPWAAGQLSGTSMASPHVAGAALLLMNAFPNTTNTQVIDCLIKTATDKVGYANFAPTDGVYVDGGVLNVEAAYECMVQIAKPKPNSSQDTPESGTEDPATASCNTDPLQDCEIPGLCTAAQGCKCAAVPGSDCACNASLGFVPHRSPATNVSRCRWDITMKGNRLLEVPLDGQVSVPIALPDGFCPASGIQVVKSVTIQDKVDCPASMHQKLSDVSPGAGSGKAALGESCGSWGMSTSKSGATVGSCYRVEVLTTDRRSYNLIFKYY